MLNFQIERHSRKNGLNICIVTGQYPPQIGGVGHSAYRVANLLAHRGMDVHVVAFQKHPAPVPFDESFSSTQEGKVLVHRMKVYYPAEENSMTRPETAILTRYNREMFEALDYFQQRYRFEVLHGFFLYPAGYIAGLVGKMHSIKVIVSIRGNDVGKYAFDPVRLPFVKSALANADYVTSVASGLIKLADRTIAPVSHKAKTILNSVDRTCLQPRNKPDIDLKGTVIGTLGLFRYKKGLLYLCKALGSLNGQFEYTLLLAGDYFKKEDRELHLQYFRKYGLSERVVITGKIPHERVADYLQLFDILVFPSLSSEGCPLSMLEGMAMKKAIIGSRTGAIPEIIRDHENGILVTPGSATEVRRAIIELIENPRLREKLAINAAKTVKRMSPEKEAGEWMGVYERILSSARSRGLRRNAVLDAPRRVT